MIKNIYDKDNKYYKHKYYCDYCFKELYNRDILRSEVAIKQNFFDLCVDCKRRF